jgi:hypothetical protein
MIGLVPASAETKALGKKVNVIDASFTSAYLQVGQTAIREEMKKRQERGN